MKKTKWFVKLSILLLIFISVSCSENEETTDNNTTNEINISELIGTWKIVSLTSNGTEELQPELNYYGICYWTETYTETIMTDTNFSGAECTTQTVDEVLPYTVNGTTISYTTGSNVIVTLEIIELTNTTLKLKDAYSELGDNYVDIYTYTKL